MNRITLITQINGVLVIVTSPSWQSGGTFSRLQRNIPEIFCDCMRTKTSRVHASVFDNERVPLDDWQDPVRNPSLTVLLGLQLFLMFFALPVAATGGATAAPVGQLLLLVGLSLVVMLSHQGVEIVIILLGLAAIAASVALGREWSPLTGSVLNRGGIILVFPALTWVVAHAVYAPGRITFHRLQGAVVAYLSLATIFAAAFTLVWEVIPGPFANLPAEARGPHEFVTMFYFSLARLTTTGTAKSCRSIRLPAALSIWRRLSGNSISPS